MLKNKQAPNFRVFYRQIFKLQDSYWSPPPVKMLKKNTQPSNFKVFLGPHPDTENERTF